MDLRSLSVPMSIRKRKSTRIDDTYQKFATLSSKRPRPKGKSLRRTEKEPGAAGEPQTGASHGHVAKASGSGQQSLTLQQGLGAGAIPGCKDTKRPPEGGEGQDHSHAQLRHVEHGMLPPGTTREEEKEEGCANTREIVRGSGNERATGNKAGPTVWSLLPPGA